MKYLIDIFNLLLLLVNPFLAIYSLAFNNKKYIGITLILIATLILLSKTNVHIRGDDIFAYATTFQHLDSFSNVLKVSLKYADSIDPLFWYPVYFISLITDDINVFLFFCYFSSLSLLYYGYHKVIGKDAIFVFILFLSTTTFYYMYGNTLRQAFVLSLSVWFLYLLIIEENKKALMLSIISIFFHPAGLFLVVVWFLSKMKVKYIYSLLLLSFILQFLPILSLFSMIVDSIGLHHFADKATVYSQRDASGSLINFGTLLFFSIFTLYLLVKKNIDNNQLNIFIKVYLIYQSFYMIFISNQAIAVRLFSFRGVLDALLLVILISYFKQRVLIKIIVLFLFLSLNYLNLTIGDVNNFLYAKEYDLTFLNFFDLLNLVEKKLDRL